MRHLTAPSREFLQRNPLLGFRTDDRRDVSHLYLERARLHQGHVHLHEPYNGTALASQQDLRVTTRTGTTPDRIGVPDSECRDHGISWRSPPLEVAHALTFAHPPHTDHSGSDGYYRFRRGQSLGGQSAIQEDARTHQVERELLTTQRGGAIGDVQQRRPARQALHRFQEPL